MSRWNADDLQRAWAFATRQHSGQTYGGQNPGEQVEYVSHIGNVFMEVCWALQTDTSANLDLALQCAVLHDTVEDTGATHTDLERQFGTAVADGVMALSKDPSLPSKHAQIEDSLRRIRSQPREIWVVKLADRIANLQGPPHYWSNQKIRAYRDDAQLIHDTLHSANATLAQRLREKIDGYLDFLRAE
jgi:(p)ppGpp synthase/HD superfamily hydrolase